MVNPIFLTLLVVVLALVAFVVEWFPIDITALMVAIVLILLGLVTPEEGISGFGNSATITVMCMFILSSGIARTGLLQVARNFLVQWGGKNPSRQILVMGALVGPMTAFINNTAVVAVFLPIVEDWCKKQRISPSKLLIPLSYATVLGGMITVIGTSTNVLASGISQQLGYGEFSLFQFTTLGIITFLVGLTYLSLVAPRLLPNRRPPASQSLSQDYGLDDYVTELVITPDSNLIGQTLRASELQRRYDIDVLELFRQGSHFPPPLADKVLTAGDILLVRGTREDLIQIRSQRGLDLVSDRHLQADALDEARDEVIDPDLSSSEEKIAEVMILSNSRLSGSTLKELRFRQRYNATVLAIRRGQELIRERMGRVPLRFGDLLLVQGPKDSILGLQTTRELLVLDQRDAETMRPDKAWIALAIMLGVIAAAAFSWMPILVSALVGVVLMILTGCLRPGEIYGAVRWDIIFLLAGLIPLGVAMQKSGATDWLATQLVAAGGQLSDYWILLFFYVVTLLLTEILSNNATVVLMLPVAVEVANKLNLNPFAFMFAVTFAASNSYMTPIGYQTNTMVYGPGGYRFFDFTRVGLPLSVIQAIMTPLLIILLYGLQPV
ncbi:SLC13 family permease [Pseudanabaena sp. FACHB-2040]|uniref:SLC13 family permease n=1 Tax=Pseudanabaena sp. FACHB-2040 TaxID=2692859 RepID=UPI003220111F